MKILWLYSYIPHRHYIHWFHTDFAKIVGQQKGIELKMYGFKLDQVKDLKKLLLQHYNPNITMKDLKNKFDFDIIIMDCHNRMFKHSSPSRNCWLPKDFNEFNETPKVLIEGDYHNIEKPNKLSKMGIDLILHRHISNKIKASKTLSNIKNLWLPCSVDNTIFKPNPNIERKEIVYVIGAYKHLAYIYRKKIIEILQKENLIKISKNTKRDQEYVNSLQNYVSCLNGSSKYNITSAKMFEIMASGSVLLTDESNDYGLQDLFYKGSYCTYKRDGSDIIKKVKKIINDINYRNQITKKAIKCIQERHTHVIRAKELCQILKKEFNL